MRALLPALGMVAAAIVSCGDDAARLGTPGIVYTYPANGQLDVPPGARIVLSFSDRIREELAVPCRGNTSSAALCIVGPDGAIEFEVEVTGKGRVVILDAALDADTEYEVFVRPALLEGATNLPEQDPLFTFHSRRERPHSDAPTIVTINDRPPEDVSAPELAPPAVLDFSSLRLLFSEPMNRSSLVYGDTVVLRDSQGDTVAASLVAQGSHLTIDPQSDLDPGQTYTLDLSAGITDLSGTALADTSISLVPADTVGTTGRIPQVLRARQPGDPGPKNPRTTDARNSGSLVHPLIGSDAISVGESVLSVELSDPKALDGPLAFVIRKGQRLAMSGLDVRLGGEVPAGLSTGDITIHLLTDVHGTLVRNAYRPADTIPDEDRNPLHTEMVLDVAVTASDRTGHAVLSQTVLGVRAVGVVTPDDGVLSIETIAAIELDLLGVGRVSTNLSLELITSENAQAAEDRTPPQIIETYPVLLQYDFPATDAIELLFDEPIDLVRSRDGIRLVDAGDSPVATTLETRGGAVIVRPSEPLTPNADYVLYFDEIYDLNGNRFNDGFDELEIHTAPLPNTDVPMLARTVYPGIACALIDADAPSPGRCAGGVDDDRFGAFGIPAGDKVEIVLHQPLDATSAIAGTSCGDGTMRVETTDSVGACTGAVPGSWLVRDRALTFVPDEPWRQDQSYRLFVSSGDDETCDPSELCSTLSGEPINFDPLVGTEAGEAGGPDLAIPFTGLAANRNTFILAETVPFTDQNGSGTVDGAENEEDANRAALRITGFSGDVTQAEVTSPDCLPSTAETEGCMYLSGHMPVAMGEVTTDCRLPDGTTAPSCIPVTIFPQLMFGTSVSMESEILGLGIGIDTDTGMMVMRVRESSPGVPATGYIVDRNGSPEMIAALSLYMDAPDMSILLSDHDLNSKPADVVLRGPMSFTENGRFRINLTNVDAIEISVNIDGPVGVEGTIDTEVPAGEMKLQLLSQPLRGARR